MHHHIRFSLYVNLPNPTRMISFVLRVAIVPSCILQKNQKKKKRKNRHMLCMMSNGA